MTTFTQTIANNTVLTDVQMNWVKVAKPVPGFNGGTMQYDVQISTTDKEQAEAWKSVMPNINIQDDGSASFTLKRPSFRGRLNVVWEDGGLLEEPTRAIIGNGSRGDIRVSHQTHPKTGTSFVMLEAIKLKELVEFVPEPINSFDF